MRFFTQFIAIVILALSLSGCEDIREGTVISKWREPARNRLVLQPTVVGNTVISTTAWYYDPESWVIEVEGVDSKGKSHRKDLYVSQDFYESTNLGDKLAFERAWK